MIHNIISNIICTTNTIVTNNSHKDEHVSTGYEKIITILLVCMVIVALGVMIWACI